MEVEFKNHFPGYKKVFYCGTHVGNLRKIEQDSGTYWVPDCWGLLAGINWMYAEYLEDLKEAIRRHIRVEAILGEEVTA